VCAVGVLTASCCVQNVPDKDGFTPLYVACRHGNVALTELLLRYGALPDAVGFEGGETALHAAARSHNVGVLKRLLDAGATVDKPALRGAYTALHCAASTGEEATRVLLERGANVNAQGRLGSTPLMCAVAAGHLTIVSLLLRGGADANLKNAEQKTAWYIAVEKNQREAMLMLEPETDVSNARTACVRGVSITVF
jgi:ankyrin repeat protein